MSWHIRMIKIKYLMSRFFKSMKKSRKSRINLKNWMKNIKNVFSLKIYINMQGKIFRKSIILWMKILKYKIFRIFWPQNKCWKFINTKRCNLWNNSMKYLLIFFLILSKICKIILSISFNLKKILIKRVRSWVQLRGYLNLRLKMNHP